MRAQVILGLVSIFGHASGTGILLPLYVYPSAVFNDSAANWQPALSAMSSDPAIAWLAVINPGNGPGPTGQPGNGDTNYISGVSQLNAKANVRTIGYVHTTSSSAPMAELQANITTWKNWDTSSSTSASTASFSTRRQQTYLPRRAVSFARKEFGSRAITTICNFGVAAAAEFYSICDVVVAFESCLNCAGAPPYASQTTISANIPSGLQGQAAVLVHNLGARQRMAARPTRVVAEICGHAGQRWGWMELLYELVAVRQPDDGAGDGGSIRGGCGGCLMV
ncbi:Spherulation-specific family 4-domain-containing protein [Mycena haematopus]|nr:Spherulation-specific family 4-domain-containing protein [Mycena haematopus]